MCFLTYANAVEAPKIKKDISGSCRNSESIIIFAKYKPYGKVAFKITTDDSQNDNSMSNERDIYMFVKEKLTLLTPHFLPGIEIGKCHQDTVFKSKFFQDPNSSFRKRWGYLRGKMIYQNTSLKKQYEKLKSKFKSKKEFYKHIHLINQKDFLFMNYVITPMLKGKSLYDLIHHSKKSLPINFDILIAIQVAQALTVAAKYKLMHHDLHAENIYIEYHHKKQTKSYKYPFKFSIETNYVVKIFDFDLAMIQSKYENNVLNQHLCPTLGICNNFIPNLDWRYFLFEFVKNIEQVRKTPLREFISGNNFDDFEYEKQKYVQIGRPCICKNQKTCVLDYKALKKFISPRTFLKNQI